MRRLINGASVDLGPVKRRRPASHFVYAIGDTEGRFIKFGHAQRPQARMVELQVCCPLTLKLMAQLRVEHRGDGWAVEELIHTAVARFHVRGEWFHSNARTLAVVEWMRSIQLPRFVELVKAAGRAERHHAARDIDGVPTGRVLETA